MKPPVSPWRWVRAWTLGGSAVGLSAAGHVLGGGHADPVLLLLLAVAVALASYSWLGRERGMPAILAAVLGVQLAAHLVLGAGHLHGGSTAMLVGHVVAAGALALLLRVGEARLFALARRRYLQWRVAVRTALAGLPAAPVAVIAVVTATRAVFATVVHSPEQGRSPPVAACC